MRGIAETGRERERRRRREKDEEISACLRYPRLAVLTSSTTPLVPLQ
jgi:hypothetical protein